MRCKIVEDLHEEHSGFAITFEVIATLAIIFMFFFLIMYFMMCMNAMRFINTVVTSTAAEGSRWGGMNTTAYRYNVSSTPLLVTAQQNLDLVVNNTTGFATGFGGSGGGFNAVISGSPSTAITYDGQKVSVWVTYSLPGFMRSFGVMNSPHGDSIDVYSQTAGARTVGVNVNSIMKAGRLLQ